MSRKNKFSETALDIGNSVLADAECSRCGIMKSFKPETLYSAAETFLNEWRTAAMEQKIMRDTAPEVPDDGTPPKKYPKREELKPTPLEVPDPEETEGASTKISVPDYGDAKRFSQAMGALAAEASKLFDIVAEENQHEKEQQRRITFDAVAEVQYSVYDL